MKKIKMKKKIIFLSASCYAGVAAANPNIVLILADDLGYGDVSCYNPVENAISTPHIDQLASEGCRFTQAYAPASVCSPTRYALLTGQYAWRGPLKRGVLLEYEPSIVDPELITLPERLKGAGYETELIGKWHLGLDWPLKEGRRLLSGRTATFEQQVEFAQNGIDYDGRIGGGPVDHGFDYYFGEDIINFPPYILIENDRFANRPFQIRDDKADLSGLPGMMEEGWRDDSVLSRQTEKVIERLARHKNRADDTPFFIYWALNAPHYPIRPSPEFKGKSAHGTYGDFVQEMDYRIGQVLRALEEMMFAENTLVIFTSDNGPLPFALPSGHSCTAGLRGIKTTGWDGGLKVPFIVRWPQKVPGGSVSDVPISLIDLYPTLAVLGGASYGDQFTDGVNIQDIILGKPGASSFHPIVLSSVDGKLAIRHGDWSYLDFQGSGSSRMADQKTKPQQLYNVKQDPGQQDNLIQQYPEKAVEMRKMLESIRSLK